MAAGAGVGLGWCGGRSAREQVGEVVLGGACKGWGADVELEVGNSGGGQKVASVAAGYVRE